MALTTLPGRGVLIPAMTESLGLNLFFSTTGLIDATGEKFAFIGRVFNKDRATKDIQFVGFRFGTVVKAGGSALTVSLQDVSTSANPPQPDEVQDQTVAIANANASFASNTWITTGNLSANRTVAFGELLAVVVEFDGAGRLGSDSVPISSLAAGSNAQLLQGSTSLKTGGTWATVTNTGPGVILGFTDGSFGTLDGGHPCSALTAPNVNSGSNPDEYANEITLPFPCQVDGMWAIANCVATTSDFDMVLYDGTTPLATASVVANTGFLINAQARVIAPFTPLQLQANTVYRVAIKPTTANNVAIPYVDVATANHWQAWHTGTNVAYTTRVDGGAWAAATTTRRIMAGLRLSALDDGTGSVPTKQLALLP